MVLQRLGGQRVGHRRRRLERRALCHVHHHLQFALVVERQHLDGDQAGWHRQDRQDQQYGHATEESPACARIGDQATHEPPVGRGHAVILVMVVAVAPLQQAQRRPGRDDEGDQEREEHCGRGTNRDGAHVGPHQPADERHRQDGRHHGQRGENGGVADFIHRADGDRRHIGIVATLAHVPHDVLHHHDRIVHQDADGEDQRKQGDAVQRVAVEIEHEERQCQRDRNGGEHDERLPPAKHKPDQQRHRDDGEEHVPEQLVRLLRGGLTVVAGDGHVEIGGEDVAASGLHLFVDRAGQLDRVHALTLGDGEGHCRTCLAALRVLAHVVGRFAAAVDDRRHIAQPHRAGVALLHHDTAQRLHRGRPVARVHLPRRVARDDGAGGQADVAVGEGLLHRRRIQPASRKRLWVELHRHLPLASTDERYLGDVGQFLQ